MNICRKLITRNSRYSHRGLSSTVPRLKSENKLTSTSNEELHHFNELASTWWDVHGPQRILHKMNLLRMDFIQDTIRSYVKLNKNCLNVEEEVYIPPYGLNLLPKEISKRIVEDQRNRIDQLLQRSKLKVLDVGCGGGILTESLARVNFVDHVKGIDLSKDVIEAAKIHKAKDPTLKNSKKLTYELKAIEDLPESEKYDMITMFEMLEHVNYPSNIMEEALKRVKKDGWIFVSTINRDFLSWFTTIFMGEYVLGIVPVGTHTFKKYIMQNELEQWVSNFKSSNSKYEVLRARGCIYLPFCGWKFTSDPNVGNYFMAIKRIK